MPPDRARERGPDLDRVLPRGNLAPEGSVIKSTAIDPSVVDADGVYRKTGRARVFTSERDAIAAIKGHGPEPDRGRRRDRADRPRAAGHRDGGDLPAHLGAQAPPVRQEVALVTDARFSGVSTGACIGHVSPEALEGGPDRPAASTAIASGSSSTAGGSRHRRPRRPRRARSGRRRRRAACSRSAPCATTSARPRAAGGHAPVGAPPVGERRPLGRLRLRQRRGPRPGAAHPEGGAARPGPPPRPRGRPDQPRPRAAPPGRSRGEAGDRGRADAAAAADRTCTELAPARRARAKRSTPAPLQVGRRRPTPDPSWDRRRAEVGCLAGCHEQGVDVPPRRAVDAERRDSPGAARRTDRAADRRAVTQPLAVPAAEGDQGLDLWQLRQELPTTAASRPFGIVSTATTSAPAATSSEIARAASGRSGRPACAHSPRCTRYPLANTTP